jgi:hypothetical protein
MTLPEHHKNLRKAFNHKGSRWLTERCYKLRKGTGKQDWIDPDVAGQLLQNWAVDEKFKNRSQKNKQNRARQEGPSYAGGSIPQSEHKRKVVSTSFFLLKYSIFCTLKQFINGHTLCLQALSGEVPPEDVEWTAFERTHTQQSEGSERRWINTRSQQVAVRHLYCIYSLFWTPTCLFHFTWLICNVFFRL